MKKKTKQKMMSIIMAIALLFVAPDLEGMGHAKAAELPGNSADSPANPVHHCKKNNGNTGYTDWSYIYFGSYPQTEVTGDALTTAITGAKYDENGDAWINGSKYRRVSKRNTNNDEYFGDKDYRYFIWERIKWKCLKNDGSTLFVVAEKGLDCKKYNEDYPPITWENCSLRSWLNNTFYHTAFSNAEQGAIIEWTVENADNTQYNTRGGNPTKDNVYLLSIKEAKDTSYGFCELGGYDDGVTRKTGTSDYAHTMGVKITTGGNYQDNCIWWLRSPGYGSSPSYLSPIDSINATYIDYNGYISVYGTSVWMSDQAVVPSLHISLSSGLWSLADDETGGADDKKPDDGTGGTDDKKPDDGTGEADDKKPGDGTDENNTNPDTDVAPLNPAVSAEPSTAEGTPDTNRTETGEIKVNKVSISGISKKIAVGKKIPLKISVSPKNASNQKVTWKTDNKKYASVNSKGVVTTKKAGKGKTVKITAEANDGSGKKAVYKIKIMKNSVTKVQIKKPEKNLNVGKSMTMKASVKTNGKNANKSLKWMVSNTKYASVNSKGKVTAKNAGKGKTVTVTAMSTDGTNKKAKVKIKIK